MIDSPNPADYCPGSVDRQHRWWLPLRNGRQKCVNCPATRETPAPPIRGLPEGLRFRAYLGDGLYAGYDDRRGAIVLTAEDGESVSNIVFLEDEVYLQFARWSGNVVRELAGRPPREDGERRIVTDLLKVIDMLMPGVGQLAIEDYKLLNEAPLRAREWLAKGAIS